MKGLVTLLLVGSVLAGCTYIVPPPPVHDHKIDTFTDDDCIKWKFAGGGHWHCSHHPLTRDIIERLECANKTCEVKVDWETGAIFVYRTLYLEGGESPRGYSHVHD